MIKQQISPAKDTEVSLVKELLALSVTFFFLKGSQRTSCSLHGQTDMSKKKSRWVTGKNYCALCTDSFKEHARFDIMEFKTKSDSY